MIGSQAAALRKIALSSVDALFAPGRPPDVERWRLAVADEVHLRVAARPVKIGMTDALAELDLLFRPILTFGTDFCASWSAHDHYTLFVECDMVVAASPKPLPFAVVIRTGRTPRFQDVRLYLDPGPLAMPGVEPTPDQRRS